MGKIILVDAEPSCLELLTKLWLCSHAPPARMPGCPLMLISREFGVAGGGAPHRAETDSSTPTRSAGHGAV